MKNLALSVRLPSELRDWLDAHSYLTGRSLNETVNRMLSTMLEAKPLDGFAVRQMGSRFVIVSSEGDTFGPYRSKEAALMHAKHALEINGFDGTNIVDKTVEEAA
ncbi:hypothetical protein BV96_04248 [Sphingomonas paucimobilis]|nr:hypothetical protein BV96_04248 [Sphingomonas paucimobilis]